MENKIIFDTFKINIVDQKFRAKEKEIADKTINKFGVDF